MDGAWDSDGLDDTFYRLLIARIDAKIKGVAKLQFLGLFLRSLLFNRQSRKRAFQVGEHHYDIGNDVYSAMLDPTMSYSCGYWKDAETLEDWHNFGQDYDTTLMAWWKNFDAAWPDLADKYGERFYRMFKYYLHACAGYFRSRHGQLWQLVLSRRGRREVYRSIR
jgi:cyclopropane fatty-acyl-phospholipid synthase-like methyltransferase